MTGAVGCEHEHAVASPNRLERAAKEERLRVATGLPIHSDLGLVTGQEFVLALLADPTLHGVPSFRARDYLRHRVRRLHRIQDTLPVPGAYTEALTVPLMRKIRWMDKLVDELAKGRPMEKIHRT